MRLELLQSKIFIACIAFGVGIMCSYAAKPIYKQSLIYYWQNEFTKLTFACDQSMRQHLIARQKVAEKVNERNINGLKSSEIGLLDCQNYDLFQKKMKRWGLADNEIAEMVLLAAEEQNNTLRKVVRIHEITYQN